MNKEGVELVKQMKSLVHSKVKEIGILIYPDGDFPDNDTSDGATTHLYLELFGAELAPKQIEIGMELNTQTPIADFRYKKFYKPNRFANKEEFRSKWDAALEKMNRDFPNHSSPYFGTLFLPDKEEKEWSQFLGKEIIGIDLVLFNDGTGGLTGLIFKFNHGQEIWSFPDESGNKIYIGTPPSNKILFLSENLDKTLLCYQMVTQDLFAYEKAFIHGT